MKWYSFLKQLREDLIGYESEENHLDIWDVIEGQVDALNEEKKKPERDYALTLCFLMLFIFSILYSISLERSKIANEVEMLTLENQSILPDVKAEGLLSKAFAQHPLTALSSKADYHSQEKSLVRDLGFSLTSPSSTLFSSLNERVLQNNDFNPRPKLGISLSNEVISNNKLKTNIAIQNEPSTSNPLDNKSLLKPIGTLDGTMLLLPSRPFDKKTKEWYLLEPKKIQVEQVKQFSLGAFSTIMYTDKSLTLNDQDQADLFSTRKDSERPLETINFGLSLNYQHRSGFGIESGFEFTQINEEFIFTDLMEQETQLLGVSHIVTNVASETVEVIGFIDQQTTTYVDHVAYNKHRLFDIPFLLTWNKRHGKWDFGVKAGLYANVHLENKGRIAVSEQRSERLEEVDFFKNNIGLSYGGQIDIRRSLSDHFSLVISPSFRILPNGFTNESYGIDQSYRLFGLRGGIKYAF